MRLVRLKYFTTCLHRDCLECDRSIVLILRAYDLLDALSKSGLLEFDNADLHVWIAVRLFIYPYVA